MEYWSKPRESRGQLVLFPTRLDEVIGANHAVRLLDDVLGRLEWSAFSGAYHGSLGQPPIHPRILAGAILYGLMTRIRSSRALEEALEIRVDFRWLVEGRQIDHSTLSEFRRRHCEALKQLFVQVGLVAREAGLLPLERLAYDGTRVRANSRRRGSRTPAELRELREVLSRKYAEQAERLAAEDARDSETLGAGCELPEALVDIRRRLNEVDAALAEIQRVEQAGESTPTRIPLTDPESRVTPNKEGGFAPNYTPLVTVDTKHGLIVACDVIPKMNEDHFLRSQIEQVQQDYGLTEPPPEMLADGMMATGANLQALQSMGVTLYSPVGGVPAAENPAVRVDPTQPVPEDQWDRLPMTTPSGDRPKQFTKDAFVYDESRDCYWCPAGKQLDAAGKTSEEIASGRQSRTRYKAAADSCAGCPLRKRCLKGNATRRDLSRFDHEPLLEQLQQRMQTAEAKEKYARRRHVAERPFAVIKQQYGVRQFLLRGLDRVRTEWCWLATAFNLSRVMALWPSRAGPPKENTLSLQGGRG